MRISDWSSDVCSSDLVGGAAVTEEFHPGFRNSVASYTVSLLHPKVISDMRLVEHGYRVLEWPISNFFPQPVGRYLKMGGGEGAASDHPAVRSEEHTSELQSLMRHPYALLRLKKKTPSRDRHQHFVAPSCGHR